ncbi:hypothetical protein LZ198_34475 [Myxococcus sp. K15C18031901]|uniref:hypothetical protein n=1 Tax=Myxococcus dinghuensis TaxID=2906761 RepID=UPI0020A78583|nr:hypothetical protein [Myxococcus dinghuensis]MCP3103992.1 hypothetical protein [Myxococcus dinghuensis]
MNPWKLAKALGWLSIGLGLSELLAPRALARFLGMRKGIGLLRAYGLREIAAGVGILTRPDPTPWVRARVAGDLLDLASLGPAMKQSPRQQNVGGAVAFVLGATAVDAYCAKRLGELSA